MAGTLTITTLSDGTNSTSTTNCIQGSAKAWVNFNGVSSASIRASYNVSSVTRNGTGDYTINFTNAFADANYSISGCASYDLSYQGRYIYGPFSSAPTTTAFRFGTTYQYNTAQDCEYIFVQVFR